MERSLTKEKTQFKKILNEKRQKIRQLEHDLEKIKTDKKRLEEFHPPAFPNTSIFSVLKYA